MALEPVAVGIAVAGVVVVAVGGSTVGVCVSNATAGVPTKNSRIG